MIGAKAAGVWNVLLETGPTAEWTGSAERPAALAHINQSTTFHFTPPPRPPHCPLSPARTRQHQLQTLRRSPRHCNGSLSATSSTHQSRRVSLTWTTTPRHSSTTAVRLNLIRLKTTSRRRACWIESSAKSAEAWAGKSSCPRAENVRVLTP